MSSRRELGAFLEWHNGSIRLVVSVPKHLQKLVGKTKLKEAPGTYSPARAETLKYAVLAKLKAELSGVAKVAGSQKFTDGQGEPLQPHALAKQQPSLFTCDLQRGAPSLRHTAHERSVLGVDPELLSTQYLQAHSARAILRSNQREKRYVSDGVFIFVQRREVSLMKIQA